MRRWGLVLLACSGGCEQVKKLPVGPVRVVPEPVWRVLEQSCNDVAQSCHGEGATNPVIFDRTGNFVGTAVIAGGLAASPVFVEIDEGRMPQSPGVLSEEGRFLLFGWISDGAPLVEAEAGTDGGDTDTDTDPEGDSGSSGPPVPDYEAFALVLDVIRGNCGGALCHRDGMNSPPVLEDAVAYDNLVGGVSLAAEIPYVQAGDADNSWVIVRLTAARGTTIMPQDGALTEPQIDVFREWITAGANP